MSYKITLRIYQTNTNAFFRVVEAAAGHPGGPGGSWSAVRDEHVLTLGGSGSAGALRLLDEDTGEAFVVVLGVHEHRRWCDVVTRLQPGQTAASVLREYFTHGGAADREFVRTAQGARCAVEDVGSRPRHCEVVFTVSNGRDLRANLIIG